MPGECSHNTSGRCESCLYFKPRIKVTRCVNMGQNHSAPFSRLINNVSHIFIGPEVSDEILDAFAHIAPLYGR